MDALAMGACKRFYPERVLLVNSYTLAGEQSCK